MSSDIKEPLLQPAPKAKPKSVSYFSLFKYADSKDKLYMLFGSICAMLAGASTPFFVIFFGDISAIFLENNRPYAEEQAREVMYKFMVIGAATWFLNFVGLYSWNMTGSRQALRFKKIYYEALLQQQIAWYDSNDVNKLATEISGNMVAIETAIGQKVSILLTVMVTTTFGFFYAFFKCWRLSLILTALLPLMMLGGVLMMKGMTMSASKGKVSYENAAAIAEQAFGGVKTVKSLVGEAFEHSRFMKALSKGQDTVIKYTLFSAVSFGVMNLIFLSIYSLGFFYGKQLIIWFPQYDAPTIIGTFFCFLVGGSSIGQISPIFKNIAEGKVAAASLYTLLDRKKTLQEPKDGVKLKKIQEIQLSSVHFQYQKVDESDEEKKQSLLEEKSTSEENMNTKKELVLENIKVKIPKGKVTAFVGQSGSGKSTIIQLLLRYYDPTMGNIRVNGVNLKQIDLAQYRQQIGFVGQEPVLFSMSVAENIKLSNPNLTEDEIKDVLRQANGWEFVRESENGLETYVGTGGAQFSGGQKQRIAIARAIAKKPSLLILDEATSALDRKNEKQIQTTLNNLSSGNITTVVIAHRLSTIQNADNIIVLNKGKIVEEGTHSSLTDLKGAYYELVKSQMSAETKELNLDDDDELQQIQELQKKASEKVVKKEEKDEKEKEEYTEEQLKGVFPKMFRQSKETYCYLFIGCLFALINGLIFPFFNIAFSNIMALMAMAEQNSDEINQYCLLFLLIAVVGGIATFTFQFSFGYAGQKLVFKLRNKVFKKILSLPVPYFDKPTNTPGALSTKISQDTYQIHNMVTGTLGVVCLNIATVSVSMFLAFYYSWKLTLIVLALAPLLVVTSAINMAFVKSFAQKSQKFEKQVGSLISDSVCNARTVKSFGNDALFTSKFNSRLNELAKISSDKSLKTALLQGLARGSIMFVEGLTFWIAGILFTNNQIGDPKSIYIAIFSVIFAAMGVGQNSQFMPDLGKAKHAGASVFQILETKDEEEMSRQMQEPMQRKIQGDLEFRNVNFRYPERQAMVLRNFNMKIKKGQKIGFVGPSGSGKSTIIQLLLRFYEIEEGEILLDGKNIKKYNIFDYRREMGLVSQQPNLFTGTVKENIIYNKEFEGNADDVIVQQTKVAHAYDFIQSWDQKFEKQVGQKGTQVSGGQKQRIALTRCLIRKPTMFLLDESTSALDTDTEKTVFENLKPKLKNHTCISIAHRLSTIEDADRIAVMRDGQIIEQGKYEELMSLGENFYRLAKGIN